MRMLYDAVVVGAGPAGSATARDIVREGLKILLPDEDTAVGRPSHCPGLVTPRTPDVADVEHHYAIHGPGWLGVATTRARCPADGLQAVGSFRSSLLPATWGDLGLTTRFSLRTLAARPGW